MLSDEQLEEFRETGFLAVPGVLDDADLQPLEQEYAQLLDETCQQLFDEGRIASVYPDDDFSTRFAHIVAACPDILDRFNISLKAEVLKQKTPQSDSPLRARTLFSLLS